MLLSVISNLRPRYEGDSAAGGTGGGSPNPADPPNVFEGRTCSTPATRATRWA